jgi:hypothetical protein
MSLVATTSSTCESVTGEGMGLSGAKGIGGGRGVGVRETTNSGETWEDSARERGRGERGEGMETGGDGGTGATGTGGGGATGVCSSQGPRGFLDLVLGTEVMGTEAERGGWEGGGGPGGVGLRLGPRARPAFFSRAKKDPGPSSSRTSRIKTNMQRLPNATGQRVGRRVRARRTR